MPDNSEAKQGELLTEIEDFIRQWEGTDIGWRVKNMLDNSDGTIDSLLDIIETIDRARG